MPPTKQSSDLDRLEVQPDFSGHFRISLNSEYRAAPTLALLYATGVTAVRARDLHMDSFTLKVQQRSLITTKTCLSKREVPCSTKNFSLLKASQHAPHRT
jgi:hypothetical protein